jgi:DNA-directed RNA polymerase III subunit RPC9
MEVLQLLDYFHEAPSPLGSKPFPYNENTIMILFERLRPYDFTKAEFLMILNLRPTKPENLNTIVEEMEGRFPGEELQLEICGIIAEVLGKPDGEAERQAMSENAIEARKEVLERQNDEMDLGE